MKVILSLLSGLILLCSCNNSAEKTKETKIDNTIDKSQLDTANDAGLVEESEKLKASIEAMAPSLQKQEILLKDSKANASIKQKWMKMDVYRDSSGMIRRIKLYPHTGVSERSEEFYYDKEELFFVYIGDHGVATENNDEGKPGKEFHFSGSRLVKYDDNSGDSELNKEEERKMYEASLPVEAKEYMEIAKNK